MAKEEPGNNRNVLFVCAANQCRSPMAMVMFMNLLTRRNMQPENWRIESAGIWAVSGYSATDFAILTMKDMDLDLNDHNSQPVTESLLNEFELILCMENEQVSFLMHNFQDSKEKVFLLSEMAGEIKDIWDPAGHSLQAYKNTAKEILSFLEKGFSKILELSE